MTEIRNENGETLQEFLDHYDDSMFQKPSNTVDMLLMTVSQSKLKVLLIKRKNHPFIHDWAMPGGFVDYDEDLDTAAQRELSEETSISEMTYFRQLYTFGSVDRDPRTRIITTVYFSMTPEENIRNTEAGDDAADAKWFTIGKKTVYADDEGRISVLTLDEEEAGIHISYTVTDRVCQNYVSTDSVLDPSSNAKLAADHIKAINMAMDQLRNRAASTGILFNLLPKECTLREIQTAYEAVIGRKTDTGNFRRDIRKMLKDTGRKKKSGGKPAALYAFNPMYAYLEENL